MAKITVLETYYYGKINWERTQRTAQVGVKILFELTEALYSWPSDLPTGMT